MLALRGRGNKGTSSSTDSYVAGRQPDDARGDGFYRPMSIYQVPYMFDLRRTGQHILALEDTRLFCQM